MQDDLDANIRKLIEAGASDDEIDLYIKEYKSQNTVASKPKVGMIQSSANTMAKAAAGSSAKMFETLDDVTKVISDKTGLSRGGAFGKAAEFLRGREQLFADNIDELPEDAGFLQKLNRKADEFIGSTVPTVAAGVGIGRMVAPLAEATIGKAAGSALAKTALSPTTQAFVKGAVTGLPSQAAANALIDGVDSFKTPQGLGMLLVGSLVDGAFGVKAFKGKQGVALGLEESTLTPSQVVASEMEGVATQRVPYENFISKLDDMQQRLKFLSGNAGPNIELTPDGISLHGTKFNRSARIEVPATFDARPWNPKAKGRTLVPSSPDVVGYSEEILADVAQRDKAIAKFSSILEGAKNGSFSQARLAKLDGLQEEIDLLTARIQENTVKFGQTAATQRGLKFSGDPKTRPGRTVIKFGDNTVDNFGNPVTYGDPTAPGSGAQSPYVHVPATQNSTPLATVLRPKVSGVPAEMTNLSNAEKHFASKIDLGNAKAGEARIDDMFVLDTFIKRQKSKWLDQFQAIKEVSPQAHDVASKFSRTKVRQDVAVLDGIFVPNKQTGEYDRIADSLGPIIRDLGGTGDQLAKFQFYAQARQAADGIETPFSPAEAKKLIEEYRVNYPDIVELYETKGKALNQAIVKLWESYGLATPNVIKAMEDNPHYASLGRSVFGDQNLGAGLKRKNPQSDKLVGDYFHNMYGTIRSLVKAGEKSLVLQRLVDEKLKNPDLPFVDIVPYQTTDEIQAKVAKALADLPASTPDGIRQAIADAMEVSQLSRGTYPVIYNGKRVGVRLSTDLDDAFERMTGLFKRPEDPVNASTVEKLTTNPLRLFARTEKGITGLYSVYRDLMAFGVPLDIAELRFNMPENRKFNMFLDPVKAMIAYYQGDPVLTKLAASGGAKGFRFANQTAENTLQGVDDLIEHASKSKLQLSIQHPIKAFQEFAGVLSNSASLGYVRRNYNGSNMSELATEFNNILGDPYRTGTLLGKLAEYTGFMNYPVQATTRQYQTLRNIPNPLKEPAKAALWAARAGGHLAPLTALAWYLRKDDPQLQELSKDANGRRFVYIRNPFDPNKVWGIPKAQGPAGVIFQTALEQALDEYADSGNTEFAETVAKSLFEASAPNVLPLVGNLGISLYTGRNIDPLTGRSFGIIPGGKQNLLPEDQGNASTSQAAKTIGEALGVSAGKVDRVFRTFLIGTSYDAFKLLDNKVAGTSGPAPNNPFTVVPGVRNVDPRSGGSRYMTEFYELSKEFVPALASLRAAANHGQLDRVQELRDKYGDIFAMAGMAEAYKRQIDALQADINNIESNEFFSPEERKDKKFELQAEQRKLAKMFIEKVKSEKK